jgi:hypothetical protein
MDRGFRRADARTCWRRRHLRRRARSPAWCATRPAASCPGVTVDASSPALIEKTRTAVTDGDGQYKIIDLRPGTYTVTFTLPRFNAVKSEGIELTNDFTATVNAELRVGAVEETVTVTGESPLIDTQSVTQRKSPTHDLIDALPTGRSFQNLSVLVPGVTIALGSQDVGGTGGDRYQTLAVHGSRSDQMPLVMNGNAVQQHEQHRRRLQHHARGEHRHRAGNELECDPLAEHDIRHELVIADANSPRAARECWRANRFLTPVGRVGRVNELEECMRNRFGQRASGWAIAVACLSISAGAQNPPPPAQTTPPPAQTAPAPSGSIVVANPTYTFIPLEIVVNRPAAEVWKRVGKYCDIGEWLRIPCTITSGKDGEFGAVRSVANEVLVGKTELSYTYTQPVREGRPYNLYHGTLEARPLTATK